jgi:hypothetical protein
MRPEITRPVNLVECSYSWSSCGGLVIGTAFEAQPAELSETRD